ncbi:MAG: hypothetical protein AAGF11_41515 [Myxococcota bacterium]
MTKSIKSLVAALGVTAMLTPAVAFAAADSMGTDGPITAFTYIGDSSSYTGNFRLYLTIDGQAYYNGDSGFCAAYAEFNAEEIAMLQQVFIHGLDVTPRYKIGTHSKRCLVGWNT